MHEPIITKEEYLQAQEKFRKTDHRTKVKGDYPLFKKVRCGTCGRSCRRDVRNPVLDPHMAYFCSYARSQTGERRCTSDVIEEEYLHQIIWEELQRLIFLVDINRDQIDDALIKVGREQEELKERLTKLKKLVQKSESKKMELMEQYFVKKITRARFQEEKDLLEKEIETYEQETTEVRNKLAELEEWKNQPFDSELKALEDELKQRLPKGCVDYKFEERSLQLSIEGEMTQTESLLVYETCREIIWDKQMKGIRVWRSSHSMDIVVFREVSKLRVIEDPDHTLCIGDYGTVEGNDYEMLTSKFSLSVDRVSKNAKSCWNIAPSGMKGLDATLYYLSHLAISGGIIKCKFSV